MINVNFNKMLQADHLKIGTTNDGHIGLLAIHDHFYNYAKALPIRQSWWLHSSSQRFRTDKPVVCNPRLRSILQYDSSTRFTTDVTGKFYELFYVIQFFFTVDHPWTQELVGKQNRLSLN